jgi:phage shock protein PspC (stress-responsive transcriptional regulator)
MDANDKQQGGGPEDPTTPMGEGPQAPPPPPQDPPAPEAEPKPRRLFRSRDDRVIGGVAGGLGRYFNLDPILFRIGFVALAFLGGAGLLLYLAGLLLLPSETSDGSQPTPSANRSALVIVGVVALLIVAWPFLLGGGVFVAAVLVPISALAIAGVLVWWLVSGEGPSGEPRDIALRATLGIGILILSCCVAIGGAFAAAAGGGTVVAIVLIGAGVALAAGAFLRPVRWLILPAVLLALSAGGVAAAGVTTADGVGEQYHHPTSPSDLRDSYELGVGQLDIDLRDIDLPPGDTPLKIEMSMGETRLAVPTDVCVATRADVGMGEVQVLGRSNAGVDVNYEELPTAPPGVSRLVVDAEIGFGHLEVRDADDPAFDFDGYDRSWDRFDRGFDQGFDEFDRDRNANAACTAGSDAR